MGGCTGIAKKVFMQLNMVAANGFGAVPILEAAKACRSAGFTPDQCAPCLYQNYPDTTADTMADVVVRVWCGEVDKPLLTLALQACQQPDGRAAYTQEQINTAVNNTISLLLLDYAVITVQGKEKVIALYQGDLTILKPAESVDYLVVSALPNDYAPTHGSLIGALSNKGVSVSALSTNKAANYEPELPVWMSQVISPQPPGIQFNRIELFEPANPASQAAGHVQDIFTALARYVGNNTTEVTMAMPLVSTGSGQADPASILTATFNSAASTMKRDFQLNCVKIAVYEPARVDAMKQLFAQLKAQL